MSEEQMIILELLLETLITGKQKNLNSYMPLMLFSSFFDGFLDKCTCSEVLQIVIMIARVDSIIPSVSSYL